MMAHIKMAAAVTMQLDDFPSTPFLTSTAKSEHLKLNFKIHMYSSSHGSNVLDIKSCQYVVVESQNTKWTME